MLAIQLESRLHEWNTECRVEENPEYRSWLEQRFPEWKYSSDFSRLSVKTIHPDGWNLLHKDGIDYICWFSPEGVMNTIDDFISEGLLMIGSSASGDFMVIDTRHSTPLSIGFVSHEVYWEREVSPRDCLRLWPDDLLTFLDKMAVDEDYVP